MILTFWVALIALALMGLGSFTFVRNTKANVNRSFAIFTLFLAVWVIANCIGANFKTHHYALYFAYADFFLGPILVYTFWRFTRSQLIQAREKKYPQTRSNLILLGATAACSISVIAGLVAHPHFVNGELTITYRLMFVPYALVVSMIALLSIGNLLAAKRVARNAMRAQLMIILWAVAIAAIALVTANLIVPQLTSSESINLAVGNVSYVGLLFFIALITYAIVKHRLFDVRLVVARSIAYIFVLSAFVILYGALSVLVSIVLPGGQAITPLERVLYVTLAIIAALIFPILKRFFDRLTNRLFYRDAYDPQELLNRLNKVLVTTADLNKLLTSVIETVSASLKCEFFVIALMDQNGRPNHIVGNSTKKFSPDDIKLAHSRLVHNKEQSALIVTDDLDYDDVSLRKLLEKNDIAVLVQLSSSGHGMGHLIIGPKKSGNPYTTQDISVVETIANELVIAVQNALRFEEIEQFNATLQQKIEEATRKLRRSNEKLRQLDETKDDFISMASHQLRTPLTSVKGYVSMVLDGDAGDLTTLQKKLLNQSFISAQRMVYLISDLLNVSRLRTGKFVIEPVPTNIANVVAEEVKQLVETAKGRNLELIYHKPEHFPSLRLDETKTRQVIMNFIDNAIYYTQSGGHITINLVDKPQSVEFTVVDDGIGVPKAEQHHLFSKFYRANNAKRARPDGTGLGLFMAKKVVVAHGGEIIFKSQEGKGSTFGFTFAKTKELLVAEDK
jgi:signal transduction histidine kinase